MKLGCETNLFSWIPSKYLKIKIKSTAGKWQEKVFPVRYPAKLLNSKDLDMDSKDFGNKQRLALGSWPFAENNTATPRPNGFLKSTLISSSAVVKLARLEARPELLDEH